MLSACLYVYADKFTACVQNVRLPNACIGTYMHAILRTRPAFSETIMVSVGVSKLGCTELFFVELGGENKRCLLRLAANAEVIASH